MKLRAKPSVIKNSSSNNPISVKIFTKYIGLMYCVYIENQEEDYLFSGEFKFDLKNMKFDEGVKNQIKVNLSPNESSFYKAREIDSNISTGVSMSYTYSFIKLSKN